MRLRPWIVCALAAAIAVTAPPASGHEEPTLLAAREDAFIARDGSADVWTIGSRELAVTVGFSGGSTLSVQRLANPLTGRAWDLTQGADASVTIDGSRVTLGTADPFSFLGADARADDNGVRLTFNFEHRALGLRISRSYACYPGSPTVETWTRFDGAGLTSSIVLSDLVGWRLTVPSATVKWLGGLRGDSADIPEGGAFELAYRDMEPGDRLELGGDRRSSERDVPFVMIDDGQDRFYGGVMWSGGWQIVVEPAANERLAVATQFPGLRTTLARNRAIEVPHTFFGITARESADPSGSLRQFILRGVRKGRPLVPSVTYNTWFAYGTAIDQDQLLAEIDRAARLGIELFVVDAGWHAGAGAIDDRDFTSGLGSWLVDPDRFPDGLVALSDAAHSAGMKFGLWIEPERAALDTVNREGLARESWLATRDGNYGAESSAQICLASADARQWLLNRLVALVDEVQPDYLKWDNNLWINCNRQGHGHGADDGNFAHVTALYDVLAELRRRYPDLLIENVSGGGNRLDFGMLAYTDAGWMDDRTAPSSHVRHNLEGLSAVFPPAYLLSFVIDGDGESIHSAHDLPLVVRSRMPGVLGLTYRMTEFDAALDEDVAGAIAQYKQAREVLAHASATLLSDQAPVDATTWDVLQELADDRLGALIFAFKSDPSDGRLTVRPRGLSAEIDYAVYSLDTGLLGTAKGDAIMRDGIELVHAGGSTAHVLILRAQ